MRVATFNLMHGMSLVDGRVDPARVTEAIAALDVDVIGLQEVDRAQPRSGHADLADLAARALGAAYHRFVPAVIGTPGVGFRPAVDAPVGPAVDLPAIGDGVPEPEYGVALISRFPVIEWRVIRLAPAPFRSPILVPGPRGLRAMLFDDEPRVLLAAVLDAPGGPMTVATTHLSFVPGWNVWQLRRVVRALRRLPAPRLLLGDLNLPARPAALVSGWRTLARRPTFPSPSPKVQLDHVLLDPGDLDPAPRVLAASTPVVAVSDHRPLVVDLAR